jgi:hypothetical protein
VLLLGAEYIEVRWHHPPGSKNDSDASSRGHSPPPPDGDEDSGPGPATVHHRLRAAAQLLAHPFPNFLR